MLNKNNPPVQLTGKLRWVEHISHLLDDRFRIPGTNFRFGLDPILNLIPVAGDLSGFVLTAGLILTMAKNGASGKIVALMTINAALDFVLGGIPFVGQVFDFFYKANTRNIKLLKEHYEEGKHQGSGKGVWATAIIAILLLLTLFIYLAWQVMRWIFSWF